MQHAKATLSLVYNGTIVLFAMRTVPQKADPVNTSIQASWAAAEGLQC